MKLNERFSFGKYKGLTLQEVYQGTQSIDNELLKAFVRHRLSEIDKLNPNAAFTFEVSDTLIRIKSVALKTIDFDLTETLNELFIEKIEDRFIDRMSLDDFNIVTAKQDENIPRVSGGQPGYITWCIKNLDFYVDLDSIESLKTLCFFQYSGVNFSKKFEDIYEYYPIVKENIFLFNDSIQEKNAVKYYEDMFEDEPHYDPIDRYGYSCACGETPCMCSDPDPG